jgi:crotonobetainyl-CoA:carnitine CoA-transferase CaiB-like acyl-CoA transferase
MRRLPFDPALQVAVHGASTSIHYARHWLHQVGLRTTEATEHSPIVVMPGSDPVPTAPTQVRIVLWDFNFETPGTGLQASAASGASWVLGRPDQPPLALPIHLPEQWCGLIGANMALAYLIKGELGGDPGPHRVDVAAADALRSISEQNAGSESEVLARWHRNGSIAVEHGGIFPQGYFRCSDGHVAIIGRSRKDWRAIQAVIGNPTWAQRPEFEDPFQLALNGEHATELLGTALLDFSRDELLAGSREHGATMAPVYQVDELAIRGVVRSDFFDDTGNAQLPFDIRLTQPAAGAAGGFGS